MRSAGKALLTALLEPTELLKKAEVDVDYTLRLSLLAEFKNLPYTDVWNHVCASSGTSVGTEWIDAIKKYEGAVLLKR